MKRQPTRLKSEHGQRILFPILFPLRIHAHQAIGEPFERTQHRIQPGAAVASRTCRNKVPSAL